MYIIYEGQRVYNMYLKNGADYTYVYTGTGETETASPVQNLPPTVEPASATYSSSQTITMSTTEQNVVIRYTIGYGSTPLDPTETSTQYTAPFIISQSAIIKAAAFGVYGRSAITVREYTIQIVSSSDSDIVWLHSQAHYDFMTARFEEGYALHTANSSLTVSSSDSRYYPLLFYRQLTEDKNQFKANPQHSHWNGDKYPDGYILGGKDRTGQHKPVPNGESVWGYSYFNGTTNIMCAALWVYCARNTSALASEVTTLRDMIKTRMLNQMTPSITPGADFSNTTVWKPKSNFNRSTGKYPRSGSYTDSEPQYVKIANAYNSAGDFNSAGAYGVDNGGERIAFRHLDMAAQAMKWRTCYEFMRKYAAAINYAWTFTSTEKGIIKKWLVDYAYFCMVAQEMDTQTYMPRCIEFFDYAPRSGATTSTGTGCIRFATPSSGAVDSPIHNLNGLSGGLNNRNLLAACGASEIGLFFKDPHLPYAFQRYYNGWMRYAVFPNGYNYELADKGSASAPAPALQYGFACAHMCARMAKNYSQAGDDWVWTMETEQGLGASVSTGNPKSLRTVLYNLARFIDQSHHSTKVHIHQKATSYQSGYIMNLVNNGSSTDGWHDSYLFLGNSYYKEQYLDDIPNRKNAGTALKVGTLPPIPINNMEAGGSEPIRNGFFGIEPHMSGMYGMNTSRANVNII